MTCSRTLCLEYAVLTIKLIFKSWLFAGPGELPSPGIPPELRPAAPVLQILSCAALLLCSITNLHVIRKQ